VSPKQKKGKPCPIALIDPESKAELAVKMYKLLGDIRHDHHDELADAKIALAWRSGWKQDDDGHVILGQCVKATDLQKEFAPYDSSAIHGIRAKK
jgi:hypothetical protein